MNKPLSLVAFAALLLAAFVALGKDVRAKLTPAGRAATSHALSDAPPEALRLVSLMPPITETLFEIGAGELVVGRSEYCSYPSEVLALPQAGTALTPNAEALVRLSPSHVLANSSEATARSELSALSPKAEFLPWLEVEEMIESTRRLGRLTGRQAAADALADRLSRELLVPEPEQGPRVLLVMLPEVGKLDPVGFLRKNSVHGRMLHAAGGRNAVPEEVTGVPEISLERVIALDPDVIVLVGARPQIEPEVRQRLLSDWKRVTPLSAARNGRIGILTGPHFYGAGSRLLRAVAELRAEIERLSP